MGKSQKSLEDECGNTHETPQVSLYMIAPSVSQFVGKLLFGGVQRFLIDRGVLPERRFSKVGQSIGMLLLVGNKTERSLSERLRLNFGRLARFLPTGIRARCACAISG